MAEFDEFQGLSSAEKAENKKPSDVKVGIILDTHSIEKPEDYEPKKAELKSQLKTFFSPDGRNTILLEDAFVDPEWRRAFLEEYENSQSFRKAHAVASIAVGALDEGNRTNFETDPDSWVDKVGEFFAEHPEHNPIGAYDWAELTVLDELVGEGYSIQPVFEEGVVEPSFWEQDEHATSEDWFPVLKEKIMYMASSTLERNNKIAKQIEKLTAEAKAIDGQTNIAMIIGRGHKSLVSLLPDQLRSLTTVYPAKTQKKPLSAVQVVLDKLVEEKKVPERDWERIRLGKKVPTLTKAKHVIRSRMH